MEKAYNVMGGIEGEWHFPALTYYEISDLQPWQQLTLRDPNTPGMIS